MKRIPMPKTKKKQIVSRQKVLWGIILILVVICGVLVAALLNKTPVNTTSAKASPSISLGSMQYHFADGKATKRNDASVNDLRAFLEDKAAHEGCPVQAPAYEHVVAYTKDETQVFLKDGCGAADSPMYAVKTSGTWKALSPTNHFDYLGLPDCEYLADNSISSEIAPVCANTVQVGAPTGIPQYLVR
jgi:hypothetical protein